MPRMRLGEKDLQPHNIHLLSIGVNEYEDDSIPNPLWTGNDARAIWSLFKDTFDEPGKPIHSREPLTGSDADTLSIHMAMSSFFHGVTRNDIAVLFYSGHGTAHHRLTGYNTQRNNLNSTTIGVDYLLEFFRQSRAKVTFIILNCCFSGAAATEAFNSLVVPPIEGVGDLALPDPDKTIQGVKKGIESISGKGRILLTSSAGDALTYENRDDDRQLGLLPRALVEQFEALEDDETIKIPQLIQNTRERVSKLAKNIKVDQDLNKTVHEIEPIVFPKLVQGAHYRALFPETLHDRILQLIRSGGCTRETWEMICRLCDDMEQGNTPEDLKRFYATFEDAFRTSNWNPRERIANYEWLRGIACERFRWRFVKCLDLSSSGLDDSDLKPLIGLPGGIEHIDLSNNDMSAHSIEAWEDSSYLSSVQALDISANTELGPRAAEALHRVSMGQLKSLRFGEAGLLDRGAEALSDCEVLRGVERLSINRNDILPEGAVSLIQSAKLASLKEFDCSRNRLEDKSMTSLYRSRLRSRLVTLNIRRSNITPEGILNLTGQHEDARLRKSFDVLEVLHLGTNDLFDAGVIHLAHASSFPALTTLILDACKLGADGFKELCASEHYPQITHLNISDNPRIGAAGIQSLAGASFTPKLRQLFLKRVGLGDGGVTFLAIMNLESLEELDISWNDISAQGMAAFVIEAGCTQLSVFHAQDNSIGDDGAAAIASSQWSQLRILNLEQCDIGERGARAIADSDTMSCLEALNLSNNNLSYDAILVLLDSETLPALRELRVRYNRGISPSQQSQLETRAQSRRIHLII